MTCLFGGYGIAGLTRNDFQINNYNSMVTRNSPVNTGMTACDVVRPVPLLLLFIVTCYPVSGKSLCET